MIAKTIRTCFPIAAAAVSDKAEEINKLNVFPVPDGDTGTNMSLTLASVTKELSALPADADMEAIAGAITHGSLMGARGNSGVILSLLFRGVAKSLKGRETASAAEFAAAVSAGVDAAYKAVMKPAEGTILTVSRLGAQAAVDFAKDSTDFEGMLDALLAAAREALGGRGRGRRRGRRARRGRHARLSAGPHRRPRDLRRSGCRAGAERGRGLLRVRHRRDHVRLLHGVLHCQSE